MPDLFVLPDFLPPAECLACQLAMDAGSESEAAVLEAGGVVVDVARRAGDVDVSSSVLQLVEARLEHRMADVARHFGAPLTEREGSGFVRYRPGGFYRRHVDWAESSAWPEAARRRVSAVLFLNSSRAFDSDGAFDGGVLRLYTSDRGVVDILPRQGMLVAFPATVPHEVTAVETGVRDAVVDWYY